MKWIPFHDLKFSYTIISRRSRLRAYRRDELVLGVQSGQTWGSEIISNTSHGKYEFRKNQNMQVLERLILHTNNSKILSSDRWKKKIIYAHGILTLCSRKTALLTFLVFFRILWIFKNCVFYFLYFEKFVKSHKFWVYLCHRVTLIKKVRLDQLKILKNMLEKSLKIFLANQYFYVTTNHSFGHSDWNLNLIQPSFFISEPIIHEKFPGD